MGQVDELNSLIGLMLTEQLPDDIRECLVSIQHCLFDLGGELSLPGFTLVEPERTVEIEKMLDTLNESLAPLEEFILPGGTRAASLCHVARCVCRRAERALWLVNDDHLLGIHLASTLIACPTYFLSWHEALINPLENRTYFGSDNHHRTALTKPEKHPSGQVS